MRLKTSSHPRKHPQEVGRGCTGLKPQQHTHTRKSRNKSKGYFSVANHPVSVTINCGIHLNVFVFFRAFRGQMGFLV
jgi:hypothetical protein